MRLISISIIFLLLFSNPSSGADYELKPGDVLITGFEVHPNCFEGNVGSFGAIKGSGYTSETAYSGNKSYKLIFAKDVLWRPEDEIEYETTGLGMKHMEVTSGPGKSRRINWAVFVMNMGPIVDESTVPVRIQPIDISRFRYLVFWVKGTRGGEQFKVFFRDVHATTYEPQLKIKPKVRVSEEWRAVRVNLRRLKMKIDLKNIVQIGITFGWQDGGKPGNVFYVDNFILVK